MKGEGTLPLAATESMAKNPKLADTCWPVQPASQSESAALAPQVK